MNARPCDASRTLTKDGPRLLRTRPFTTKSEDTLRVKLRGKIHFNGLILKDLINIVPSYFIFAMLLGFLEINSCPFKENQLYFMIMQYNGIGDLETILHC